MPNRRRKSLRQPVVRTSKHIQANDLQDCLRRNACETEAKSSICRPIVGYCRVCRFTGKTRAKYQLESTAGIGARSDLEIFERLNAVNTAAEKD